MGTPVTFRGFLRADRGHRDGASENVEWNTSELKLVHSSSRAMGHQVSSLFILALKRLLKNEKERNLGGAPGESLWTTIVP
jgi:hypothetical protein